MIILALDFETGGTVPGEHAQVSLGVALMDEGGIIDSAEWVFAPVKDWKGNDRRKYEVRALEVSGYTWKRILAGKPIGEILADLRDFADSNKAHDVPVIAFNAAFDLAMYTDMLFLCGEYDPRSKIFHQVKPPLVGPWICSKMLAQDAFDLPDYKLDTVAAEMGFSRSTDKHGALEDAVIAGKIYFGLQERRLAGAA